VGTPEVEQLEPALEKLARLVVVLGCCALPSIGSASDEEEHRETSEIDLFKLDAILNGSVVTASGGPEEERSLASANVYTITREEIAAHGWRSLAELLANTPGLYVDSDLVLPSLGVRGVTGGFGAGTRVVKIMIDGQVVNFRPELAAFLGPEYIPIEAVERVEVAKGPLSALYGANAFIATINVITRQPPPGFSGELDAHGGVIEKGGFGGSTLVSYGGEDRGVTAALAIDQISRSGLRLPVTFGGQDPTAGIFQRTSTADVTVPLSAFVSAFTSSPGRGRLSIEGGLQRLDSMGEFQLNSVLTHQTRIALVNIWSNAHYQKDWAKAGLELSAGYSQGEPTRDERLYLTDNHELSFQPRYGYNAVDATVAARYSPLDERLSLRAGLDFEYSSERVLYYSQTFNVPEGVHRAGDTIDLIAAGVPRRQDYLDIAAFVQATSAPLRRLPDLRLTANLRIDKISFGPVDFPAQYSWRAAIAYRWNGKWVSKLIAGRAFQTPSGIMLFAQPGFGNAGLVVGSQVVPVPGFGSVGPQTVTSVEAVASGSFLEHFALEASVYFQDLEDKIEFVQTGYDFVATNQGQRLSVGLEASLRFTWQWLSAYGNGTVEGAFSGSGFDGHAAALYPRGLGVIGVDVDLPRMHLHGNAQARIVGPRGGSQSNVYLNNNRYYELPTYGLVDLTISTAGLRLLGAQAGETRFVASGRNLADQRTPDPGYSGIDLPRLGRSFFFEIRQSF
jgi:iron complex outermembrane receptor protein